MSRDQPRRTTFVASRELELPEGVWVGLLVGLFVVLSLVYGHLLPYGQGPDEESHGLFVQTLAGQAPPGTLWAWGLPVLSTAADDPNFEVHQPPLYYGLAATGYRLAGLTAASALSLLCGALLVWLTWRLVRAVAPADLALAAATIVALLPMNLWLASRVNNDPLANLLCAGALWRWTVTIRDGASRREGILCGVLTGLALLTKQNCLLLLPLTLLAAALTAKLHGDRPAAWRQAAVTIVLAAAIAGWWYARNLAVYGDLFAQSAFDARFLSTRLTPDKLAAQFVNRPGWSYWPYVGQWIVQTSVIYIGHNLFRLPQAVYPEHLCLLGWCAVGALWWLVGRWRRGFDAQLAVALLLATGAALTLLLLLQFNRIYFQAQGRYLYLMLPAWALLLAAGPSRCFPAGSVGRKYGQAVLPLWFALLNLLLLTAYIPGLLEQT